jgi:hypothetical protein
METNPNQTPAEIEGEIHSSIAIMQSSVLSISLNLINIKKNCLYKELGCQFMSHYVTKLCKEIKVDRSAVNKWLRIGLMYEKYRDELEKINFSSGDGPTKLLYLERALANNPASDVFASLKTMTVREFMIYSRGKAAEEKAEEPYVKLQGSEVFIDGLPAVTINKELSGPEYRYFRKINWIAGKAIEEGGRIVFLRLRNRNEAARYQRAATKIIAKMRSA